MPQITTTAAAAIVFDAAYHTISKLDIGEQERHERAMEIIRNVLRNAGVTLADD